MIVLSSLLVDVEALADDQPALATARDLAAACHARLTIADVLPLVPSRARSFVTPALEQELVDHRAARLRDLAATVPGASTVLLRGRPATALIHEVQRGGHGLVVRAHDRDLAQPPRRFGAVDMELLRACPCPVWLVGRRPDAGRRWRIAAAIDATPEEAAGAELNTGVLDWALLLRDITGAELTLLHAWAPFGAGVLRSRVPAPEFAEYVAAAQRTADDAMRAFTRTHAARLAGVAVQVIQGEPEEAICRFVGEQAIDLVVMGTVARSGLRGLLMGNTAERVLQCLRGSVLAVKPPGFVSPVAPASPVA
jgi:nucleotide-binding universal stress UspA family protein